MAAKRRALGVIRLSELKEDTTSPDRQKEIIIKAAELRDSEIVGWAEDLDVRASAVHPLQRPELGPWLSGDQLNQYDEIIFWRLDRFVRKVFPDFADMIAWSQTHDKGLVSATEPIDLASPLGRAMATLVAIFAEIESSNTRERVLGAHAYLRSEIRWPGGTPPYGYRTVKHHSGKGLALEIDPESSLILREVIDSVTAGRTVSSAVDKLNARGIKTNRGKPHSIGSMIRILTSEALLGRMVHNGKSVTGKDGMPVMRAEPLISLSKWNQLQKALEDNSRKKKRTNGASLLLGVAYCVCGAKLYRRIRTEPGYQHKAYHCSARKKGACSKPDIRAVFLEGAVEDSFLAQAGKLEVFERVYIAGEDHTEELAQVRRALDGVRAERDGGAYEYPGGEDDYAVRVERLVGRLKTLSALPQREAGYELRPTGRTYADAWFADDSTEARRDLLLQSGLRVDVDGTAVHLFWPEDLQARMRSKSPV